MKSKGRPRETAVTLRDGFYIEIFDKGTKKGMKIRSEDQKAMEDIASRYAASKDVIVLGQFKDGVPFVDGPVF
jgi:hypothetical protein